MKQSDNWNQLYYKNDGKAVEYGWKIQKHSQCAFLVDIFYSFILLLKT